MESPRKYLHNTPLPKPQRIIVYKLLALWIRAISGLRKPNNLSSFSSESQRQAFRKKACSSEAVTCGRSPPKLAKRTIREELTEQAPQTPLKFKRRGEWCKVPVSLPVVSFCGWAHSFPWPFQAWRCIICAHTAGSRGGSRVGKPDPYDRAGPQPSLRGTSLPPPLKNNHHGTSRMKVKEMEG